MTLKTILIGIALLILSLLSAITSQTTDTNEIVKEKTIYSPTRQIIAELFLVDITRTYSKALLEIKNNMDKNIRISIIGRDIIEKNIEPKQTTSIEIRNLIDLIVIDIDEAQQAEKGVELKLILTMIERPYAFLAIVSLILFIGGNIVLLAGIIGASIESYRRKNQNTSQALYII